MFSSSHRTRPDRLKQGFTIIPATLFILLLLLIPAATAENITGSSPNASLMANSVPVVTTLMSTQQPVPNTTLITTVPTTVVTPSVKPPKIEFTVTPAEGVAPLAIMVYPKFNQSGGAPQYVVLDFGDGQQLNETLKTSYAHTYQVAGSYMITLTSVNAGGSNVETLQSPIIVQIPVAVATSAPATLPTTLPTTVPNTTVTIPVTTIATTALLLNATGLNATIPPPLPGVIVSIPVNDTPCFYPNLTLADFRATPVEGPAPLRVNFFDNSSCAPPVGWQWDFGSPVNPGIKTMRDPIVTYAEPGTYNVTLFVINSFNNNSTKTITGFIHVLPPVTPIPYPVSTPAPAPVPVIVPNFTANQTTGQAPLCVQFTDSSTGSAAVTWFWDFGDGSNATMKNPAHCYNTSGNYSVSLKTAPAGGAPAAKVRESYIIVSSGSASFPMDLVVVAGIIIVILVVVGIFVMKRNGGSHHAHSSSHHDESMKPDHESSESKGPRHGRDL